MLAALALPGATSAQIVTGWVLEGETGTGIPGADVTLHDTAGAAVASSLTAEDGRFVLLAPEPGSYTLRATRLGYVDGRTAAIDVGESESVVTELLLSTDAVVLEPLRVVARDRNARQRLLREHYLRMRRLEDAHGRTMFPRTELVRYDGWSYDSFMKIVAPRTGRIGCAPVVYWDGWKWTPDAYMPIADIEGIEFHGGMGPVDTPFVNERGCGVILVWTRPHGEEDRFTAERAFLAAGVVALFVLMGVGF